MAVRTATKLDSLTLISLDGNVKTRWEHFYGELPTFARSLKIFGEAGTVMLKTATTPNVLNKGVVCMFVEYPDHHASNCWIMFNLVTRATHTTRDVVWLHRMYYPDPQNLYEVSIPFSDEEEDNDESLPVGEGESGNDSNNDSNEQESEDEDDSDDQGLNTIPEETEEEVNEENDNDNVGENDPTKRDDVREPFQAMVAEQEEELMDLRNERVFDGDFRTISRTGRKIRRPQRLIETDEFGSSGLLTKMEENYYSALMEIGSMAIDNINERHFEMSSEMGYIGAALGGGFENTNELRLMKYQEAMKTKDKEKWKEAVKDEYKRLKSHNVFKLIPKESLPEDTTILTSTWAMKKKTNGTFRACVVSRGYEQVDGEHYDKDNVASPTVNIITVRIMMVLMILMCGYGHLVDINGAFLLGNFESDVNTHEEREVHMEVPEGFLQFLPPGNWVMLLLRTLYGNKQAAKRFWLFILGIFVRLLGYKYNRADPCLFYKWTDKGLVLWSTWVDDCLSVGPSKDLVIAEKNKLTSLVKCDDTGELKEYVGCKVDYDRDKRTIKLTQPVLLQSFEDEFKLPQASPKTPAAPQTMLQDFEIKETDATANMKTYRKGVGKLLYLMRWSRPDILNATREVSKFMRAATDLHVKALYRILDYCVATSKRGLVLKPTGRWDGIDKDYEFSVSGVSDTEFCKDQKTRRSVGGHVVYLNLALVAIACRMQRIVALSVTEAELIQIVECAQDMLFVWRLLTDMGLKVNLPMILESDNQGAINIVNNWSSTGCTRYIDCRLKFLREMKEANVIRVVWRAGENNESDVLTKNLPENEFLRHVSNWVDDGEDVPPR